MNLNVRGPFLYEDALQYKKSNCGGKMNSAIVFPVQVRWDLCIDMPANLTTQFYLSLFKWARGYSMDGIWSPWRLDLYSGLSRKPGTKMPKKLMEVLNQTIEHTIFNQIILISIVMGMTCSQY